MCRAQTFHGALLQRGVCAERLAMCEAFPCRWCAHRARTAKRLWHTPMAGPVALHWRGAFGEWGPKGKSIAKPLAGAKALGSSPSAEPLARALAANGKPPARPRPVHKLLAPRQWQRPGLENGSCQTVLQCAPCARTQGSPLAQPLAKRFAQSRALSRWLVKGQLCNHSFHTKARLWYSHWQSASHKIAR